MDKLWPLIVILAGLIVGMYVFWGAPADDQTAEPSRQFALVYPYNILATNEIVAEVARAVAGDHATVTVLVPSGVDPRTFVLDEEAMAKVAKADYILLNGRGLEATFEEKLRRSAGGKPVYGVADALGSSAAVRELSPGEPDPAAWLNVTAWKDAPLVVRDRLRAFDSLNEIDYDRNAGRYHGQLETLIVYGGTLLLSVPEKRRLIVTGENLMGHFAAGTRFPVEAVLTGSMREAPAERTPDPRVVQRLVDILEARAPMAVFRQYGLDNSAVDTLVAAARAKNVEVVEAGEFYTLSPGPAGSYTGTYVGMMDHNLTLLTLMLGGTAPASGLNGTLDRIQVPSELIQRAEPVPGIDADAEAAARRRALPTTLSRPSAQPSPTPVATPQEMATPTAS